MSDRKLMDSEGNIYSANAGDYWNMKPEDELKGLVLVVDGEVVNEHPKKKDLVDEIYEAQDIQSKSIRSRKKIVGRVLRMRVGADEYAIDPQGRILQWNRYQEGEAFTDQWALFGLAHRWNAHPKHFDDIQQDLFDNPSEYIGWYVYDLDNGTVRGWGKGRIKDLNVSFPHHTLVRKGHYDKAVKLRGYAQQKLPKLGSLGSGWHKEPISHSYATKYGKAPKSVRGR